MSGQGLFDEGAALERTHMAWVRTALGLLATSAIAVRLMLDDPTWLTAGVAAVGGLGAAGLLLVSEGRHRAVENDLWSATALRPATAAVRAATWAVLVLSSLLVISMATGARS